MEYTVEQIAELVGGEVEGDKSLKIVSFVGIEETEVPGAISFLSNEKYTEFIYTTSAAAVLVSKDFRPSQPLSTTLIRVDFPYQALAKLLKLQKKHLKVRGGKEKFAFISKKSTVAKSSFIGAFSYIASGASIGDNCIIYPNCYIGKNVTIGNNCIIYSGVNIYQNNKIGNHCILHSGVVIGSDGFGFAMIEGGSKYQKIEHRGKVILEDHVEVGANTCIDRATLGTTIVRKGVKLDNLIQIAHNVDIGQNTVIAAQTGLAGSTKVGKNCMFGGQVGLAGHIEVANGVKLGAQSGVPNSILEENISLIGTPPTQPRVFFKTASLNKKLPEMDKKLEKLQQELDNLKKQLAKTIK